MSNDIVYKLEITMESRIGDKQLYIKRSFPINRGKLELGKYGDPYKRFGGSIVIGNFIGGDGIGYLEVSFNDNSLKVYLNSFVTVKKEYVSSHIDSYMKSPVMNGMEIVHTTFYLYVE